jgi:hypothetical protein
MMIVMVYCELYFLFTEDSDDNVLSTDDDDDAPEDVSFQTGKQTALQQMRDAIKHINEEKIRVKEKRRKIDQQFKEQKVNIYILKSFHSKGHVIFCSCCQPFCLPVAVINISHFDLCRRITVSLRHNVINKSL